MKYKDANLQKLINSYDIDSHVKSVFCINSWRNNRCASIEALKLNHSLAHYKPNKKVKSISTYEDFSLFFREIESRIGVSELNDYCICDFGEIKIKINNEFYPVIIGNGYVHTYEALFFLENIAKKTGNESILKNGLTYLKKIIEELRNYNINNYNDGQVHFELPSKQYYNHVCDFISALNMDSINTILIESLNPQKTSIERAHFFSYKEKNYPLFNASFTLDILNLLLRQIDFIFLSKSRRENNNLYCS